MTFLSPFYLWFLPLIAIPIIIHLLAKQKSTLIDFPSLKFLKLLEQDALRKFNIKQLLLLIIRTLMVLLIILIFARPSINRLNGFGLYTQSTDLLIFLIDNTASNRSNIENNSDEWLTEIGGRLTEKGIQVFYCGLTDLELQDHPASIGPSYADAMQGDFLDIIGSQIDLDRFNHKSIVWIGDGQDVDHYLASLAEWDRFLLRTPVLNDVGISSAKLPKRGVRKGAIYQLGVGIERGLDDEETLALELMINDKRENQVAVQAEASFVELNTKVTDPGFQNGKLELAQDEHPFNNAWYFVLPASGNIPVQILRSIQTTDFWSIFENSVEKMELNLDIRTLDYSEVDNLDLSAGGTIILDNASAIETYNWNRLNTFLSKGGQLIVFGNGGANLQKLLGFKTALIEEDNPQAFGLFYTEQGQRSLKSQPLEMAISENRLKVFKRYNTGSNELDETWIRYLDDHPFLGASGWGAGRIVWFNTDFGVESNNFTYLGVFPTLILQLSQSQDSETLSSLYNVEIGDTLHFVPNTQSESDLPFSIQEPDGIVEYQAPDSLYMIHYSNTHTPGIYNLMQGRHILQPVAVNISSHEAMAHSKTYDFEDSGVFISEKRDEMAGEILDRRSGQALWPLLLSLLLLLWIVETYLSRIKRTWRQDV